MTPPSEHFSYRLRAPAMNGILKRTLRRRPLQWLDRCPIAHGVLAKDYNQCSRWYVLQIFAQLPLVNLLLHWKVRGASLANLLLLLIALSLASITKSVDNIEIKEKKGHSVLPIGIRVIGTSCAKWVEVDCFGKATTRAQSSLISKVFQEIMGSGQGIGERCCVGRGPTAKEQTQ